MRPVDKLTTDRTTLRPGIGLGTEDEQTLKVVSCFAVNQQDCLAAGNDTAAGRARALWYGDAKTAGLVTDRTLPDESRLHRPTSTSVLTTN